ncbi:methyl-accepting chemotaxis protein [Roseinatronobacter alkalisoli]|uniref:Methyl-accepting chemotaxis protein n=1 Tax=Roseinatronobacter alkalisoli TaxID=3028235 RepID=A0ABT5TBT3_9RHOB|nr:methyl-accepting chemotaxis protein [Roseinatronobacter sp. HJB301]MDD7972409.1 methyl-accepting chemotaxis protein [Roseinatronobacter sp. HJB301]
MIKNTNISTQIAGGFAVVLILIIGLGLFSWQRLAAMSGAVYGIEDAMEVAISAAELGREIAEAGLAVRVFTQTADPADGDTAVSEMLDVRRAAVALVDAGFATARHMVVLKDRHIEELSTFVALYKQREELKEKLQDLGIEHRRNLGRLVTLLETRDADAAAYLALRASENFLVTRVRVDRFVDGMPLSELDTATAPYETTLEYVSRLPVGALMAEERALLGAAQRGLSDFWAVVNDMRDAEMTSRAALSAIHETTTEVIAQLSTVQAEILAEREKLNASAHNLIDGTVFSVLAGVAFAALLGAAIAGVLSVTLSRRLAMLLQQTNRLAEGDLSLEIASSDGKGDLTQMTQALRVFKDNAVARRDAEEEARRTEAVANEKQEQERRRQARVVRDIEDALTRLAQGELTHAIPSPENDPFPAEYEELRTAFNTVASNLADTMSRIVGVAEQVRGGSEEITSAAQDLSGRAETQAATLEESAAALNELTESVRSTAALAKTAENMTRDNRMIAEEGTSIVRDAISAMQKIEKSSDQINRIIGVIDDIAFQTNLLALNAGVEAARAGEAGRGFAVVASEVRGLAQRASESAREIKGLISESAQQVEAGSSLVTRTGGSLEQILHKAKDVSDQASAIAIAAADQSSALGEINSGVNQLDQVTQQNAAVAEETNAAADSLQQQADILLSELSNFRFEKSAGRSARVLQMPKSETAISAGGFQSKRVVGRQADGAQARLVEF